MKKIYYVVAMLSLFILVGCGNSATGDKVLYKDVKKSLMSKINSYDEDKKKEVKEEYGLDDESLDDMPLALYNIKGKYVGVIEVSSGDYEYFYYSSKKKEIVTKIDQSTMVESRLDGLTPVYSQNNFKAPETK